MKDIMNAKDTLLKAADLVGGDRARQHGDKLDNMTKIATLWNAWLLVRRNPASELTAFDVAQMMALMKKARTQSGSYNPDDLIDDAGYTGVAAEIASLIEGDLSEKARLEEIIAKVPPARTPFTELWDRSKAKAPSIWYDEDDPVSGQNG